MVHIEPSANQQQVKHETAGMYDRAASLYDQVGVKSFSYYARLLVQRLDIRAGGHALDLATGRGALLLEIADRVGPDGCVLGIDLAPSMIQETAAEIHRRGLRQAEVRLLDAEEIDFPLYSFDDITCGFALHFLDYPRLLPRLRHMLKPSGLLGTTHPYMPTHDSENMQRWEWLFRLTRESFPPGFVPPASWVAPNRLNSEERITAVLQAAGFTEVSASCEEVLMHFADEDDWWAWEWSQGSRFWLEGMSPDALATFKKVSFERLREMKTPQGIPIKLGAVLAVARPG